VHNAAEHFRSDKSYTLLQASYCWPNMPKDLVELYIPSYTDCLCNKSKTMGTAGPLDPLPIPDEQGDSVAIDFIGPLPDDNGFNMLILMTDRLNSNICLVPCKDNINYSGTPCSLVLQSLVLQKQITKGHCI
jgi:hypothetical protein